MNVEAKIVGMHYNLYREYKLALELAKELHIYQVDKVN